jgi:hypothetical protein
MKKLQPITLHSFRETERGILAYLLEAHINDGSYFGRKDQHYKMCKELLEKLSLKRPY